MSDELPGIALIEVSEFASVNQAVYSALRKAIFDSTLRAGDRIVEVEVARELGISRAPVREALHRLRQAGLVEHKPRRGWFVARLSPEDMWDIYNVRAFVEGLAARRVARDGSPEVLTELESLLEKMMLSAQDGDLDELATNDVQFHELIVRQGGSNQLYHIWRLLHPQDWTIMSVLRLSDVAPTEIAERHRVMIDALTSQDPDWAEAVAKRHILGFARQVVDSAEQSEAAVEMDADVKEVTDGVQAT
jgi:DNA-binding GntR family transcriptional regulator